MDWSWWVSTGEICHRGSKVDTRWKQWLLVRPKSVTLIAILVKKNPRHFLRRGFFWFLRNILITEKGSSWHSYYWARAPLLEPFPSRLGILSNWDQRAKPGLLAGFLEREWGASRTRCGRGVVAVGHWGITWIFRVSWSLSLYRLQSGPLSLTNGSQLRRPYPPLEGVCFRGKGWALGSGRPEFKFWFYFLLVLWTSKNYLPFRGTSVTLPRK